MKKSNQRNMNDHAERMYELMRKEGNRLKTFRMNPPWPKDYVDIKKLAKAGFFYTFSGDKVHCAFCRGQVCRWDRDDDPMSEHAKHFTTCPFIMGGEVGNEPLGEDPFPGPKRPRPYDVCGTYPPFPPNDTRSQQVFGEVPHPPQQHQNDAQSDISSINSLYQFNHDYGYNRNEATQQIVMPPPQQTYPPQDHMLAYDDSLSNSRAAATVSSSNSSSNCSSSVNSLTGICKICYTNSIELVFLPCGHSVSCISCAQRLFNCPFCRATITTRIRTFLV